MNNKNHEIRGGVSRPNDIKVPSRLGVVRFARPRASIYCGMQGRRVIDVGIMQENASSLDDGSSSVDIVYRVAPIGVALSLGLAVVYCVLLWPVAVHQHLMLWLGCSAVVAVLRLHFVRRYLKYPPAEAEKLRWHQGFIALAAVSALLWGSIAIFFFTEDQPLYQFVSFSILAGMAAAATSTMAASPLCIRVYLLSLLMPLFGRFVWQGTEVYLSLAVLVLVLIATLAILSKSVFALTRNLQKVKHDERFRRDVMEMMAKGAPLSRVLNVIVAGVEERGHGAVAAVLFFEPEQKKSLVGAAPGLPENLRQQLNGSATGPWGIAMLAGEVVEIEDVSTHPACLSCRDALLAAGLRSCRVEPVMAASGQVLGAFVLYRPVTGVFDAEDTLHAEVAAHLCGIAIERYRFEEERELATLVYRNTSEGMMVTNTDGFVIAVNEAFHHITGYSYEDVKGKAFDFSARSASDEEDYRQMMEAILSTGKWQGVLWSNRKNGERFACRVVVNSIFDAADTLSRRVMLISDITEQKRSDELIWRQANYDPLIGLPNRRLFRDRLEQEIKKAQRSGCRMGLLFLDLDQFKEINDTLGHDVGDMLLVEASRRIASCVRDSDTVARLGGDEFTVILSEIEDNAIIERVAEAILDEVSRPFLLGDEVVYISVSIGITVFPDDSREVDELLKYADLAMYASKNGGRNRFTYFTSAAQKEAQQRLLMVADLRDALAAGQLCLHYQPIYDVRTHSIAKVEALLRWKHPLHGMVSPLQFIPRAEESGLMHEIGDWVFREVARVSKRWVKIAGGDFQVGFNMSAMQLRSADACVDWLNYLVGIGVRGRNLCIEVNESLLLEATPRVIEQLRQFQNAGISIGIDDFGTGYSSLSYLKKFDIDYLKIDQSFVRDLTKNASDRTLAETIVVMGHKLGLKIVAEGVETYEQGHILATAGCDYAQGNLFSRPLPERDFETLLLRSAPAIQTQTRQ